MSSTNTAFAPISDSMPLDRAADLMVRRGEERNWHRARAILQARRARAERERRAQEAKAYWWIDNDR